MRFPAVGTFYSYFCQGMLGNFAICRKRLCHYLFQMDGEETGMFAIPWAILSGIVGFILKLMAVVFLAAISAGLGATSLAYSVLADYRITLVGVLLTIYGGRAIRLLRSSGKHLHKTCRKLFGLFVVARCDGDLRSGTIPSKEVGRRFALL